MSLSESIIIKYKGNLGDLIKASRLYYSKTPIALFDKALSAFFAVIGAMLIKEYGAMLFTLIPFLLTLITWTGIHNPRTLQVFLRYHKDELVYQEVQITISNDGLLIDALDDEVLLEWTQFKWILEDNRLILLVMGDWQYLLLPKRAFTKEQLKSLMTLISDNIPVKKV